MTIYVTTQTRGLALLGRLVNLAASSVKIRRLILQEQFREQPIRPQLHLFISAPFGQMKSTLLGQIAQAYPAKIYTHLTFPSLIGSIDRSTKQIIPAAAWECRNRLMLLDEFTKTRPSLVHETLLQLMENQHYSRKISVYSADKHEEDGDLFFKVKQGNIELKTRFALIFATMKNIRKAREYTFKALLSRTIPIRYEMTKSELDQVLDGKLLFKKEEYKVEPEVTIKTQDYTHIRNVLDGAVKGLRLRRVEEIYARTVGDCCRIFAVLGEHDDELYRDVLRLKYTFK